MFLDRVRQPYFERERAWYEAAFDRYPQDRDARADGAGSGARTSRSTVRRRGSSTSMSPGQARWELTPHPVSPDGKRSDFLVTRPGHGGFYLECAVDLPSKQARGEQARWGQVREALNGLPTDYHGLRIERRSIGMRALPIARLIATAQAQLTMLAPGGRATLMRVREDGWAFTVEAVPEYAGGCVESSGGGMSMEARLYGPLRHQLVRKARKASRLDRPLVVALLVDFPLPILSKPDVVREALFGMPVTVLGLDGSRSRATAKDGVWIVEGKPTRQGVSALLVAQDLWVGRTLPELHHHPAPHRRFDIEDMPFRTVTYDLAGEEHAVEVRAEGHEVFGLPADWPGPENSFEGINTPGHAHAGGLEPGPRDPRRRVARSVGTESGCVGCCS